MPIPPQARSQSPVSARTTVQESPLGRSAVTVFQDRRSGSATVRIEHGLFGQQPSIVVGDGNEHFEFSGNRAYAGRNGDMMEISPNLFGGMEMICRDLDGDVRRGTVDRRIAEAAMRERVQAFEREHPELAAAVALTNVPAGTYNGQPVGLYHQIEQPTRYEGCPADSDALYRRR